MRLRVFFLMLPVLCFVGCTSMGRLDKDVSAPSAQDSIFVLGVAPENHRVLIFPGNVKDGVFHQNPWLPATFYGSAEQGFVVGKAKAGTTLAITMVQIAENESSIFVQKFVPCNQAKTIVFQALPGQVVYLGNVMYGLSGGQLRVAYWNDIEQARSYVSEKYPALVNKVQTGSYELLPTDGPCSETVYVPIYIAR